MEFTPRQQNSFGEGKLGVLAVRSRHYHARIVSSFSPGVLPRILIVEDDDLSREAMIELLGTRRYELVGAADLSQARRLMRESTIDVILLDLMLPDGYGSAVLRYIREAKLPIRVAVITAAYDARLLTDVANLRPDAFFTKP